jgi:inner membrane transporter RhtA
MPHNWSGSSGTWGAWQSSTLHTHSHSTTTAVSSAVVAMVSFQLGATFAKQLIPIVGAPGTTALRLGLSALIVVLLQRPWRSVPAREAWPVVLAYGLSLGAMNAVFYLALRTIPLGIAVAIEFIGPLAVAVFASRRRLDYVWVALAAVGLSLLLPITSSGSALDPVGVLFALAAGVGWALYIVFGQKAGRAHGASASTWGLMIAAAMAVPIGVVDAGPALVSPSVLPFGVGVAIFSSALPYTLEMIALRRLSAKAFGTLMSFEPAIAAVAGVLVLHEHLSGLQYLAIGAIIAASVGAVTGEPSNTRADFAP